MIWFKKQGVPDVSATVTIHEHNYRYLDEIANVLSKNGIWLEASMLGYSKKLCVYDYVPMIDKVKRFLIKDRKSFKRSMHRFANEMRNEKWLIHNPPEYFEFIDDVGGNFTS